MDTPAGLFDDMVSIVGLLSFRDPTSATHAAPTV